MTVAVPLAALGPAAGRLVLVAGPATPDRGATDMNPPRRKPMNKDQLQAVLTLLREDTPTELAAIEVPDDPWGRWLGLSVIVRTVTMIYTGTLVETHADTLVLEDVAWIADTGRWADALASGEMGEVEPYPAGQVLVGRGTVVDACRWGHALPVVQK